MSGEGISLIEKVSPNELWNCSCWYRESHFVNHTNLLLLSVFGSVVAGIFQITFRAKMHVNDVFLFFKNHFWHQHIKTIQNI